ncbi:hypothetical protein B0H14DRAFT_3443934 [Mycena olivaceomarginata]|nr:hypothetical protein B0H14DRAFT_3443934 [Mycena olivaceomarginata]
MDLPQDLFDTILDILHDDIPSLKSCFLAARIFRFYELLCSSPHIAPLVKGLCIVSVLEKFPETCAYLDPSGDYMSGRALSLILSLLS